MANNGDLKNLLLKQYQLYPKMQLQDMVKFIYQNEFAGGHMIPDENESLKHLKDEFHSRKKQGSNKTIVQTFESIGNGLCRLHLSALEDRDIELETINKFFVSTANSVKGSVDAFEEKLHVLRECCQDGSLPYSLQDLDAYLEEYKIKGYPPVSHSDVYRELYNPSYRIVKEEYCRFFELFDKIDALMKLDRPICVAIDGNSGAGKSTLADLIGDVYDCNIFHMDDFFLTPDLRTEERLREVGGNVDYVRFNKEIIQGLKSGREFAYQPYNCQIMSLEDAIYVKPKKLNIIEGVYSMHPTLIDTYDLKVFMSIDPQEQSRRILERNGPFMHKRFIKEWIPLENRYFEVLKIKEKCDLVFEI
ncbi:MAG: hypothetical protein GX160_10265 [Clostridiales bacterium]|nr:hypothetical protein [Clostridiales bacterium]